MPSSLRLRVPSDYLLYRDVCSYGYFLLAPNRWDVDSRTFATTVDVGGAAVSVELDQGSGASRGDAVRVQCDAALDRAAIASVKAQLSRLLRLDEDASTIRAFHAVDPRWRRSGRGRLLRSATLFEDVIKTVTSCNVAWPSTVRMNSRMCEVCGRKSASGGFAFPTARKLARTRPQTLRSRCGVGYRDVRIVELAKRFVAGDVDEAWMTDPATSDDAVFTFLKSLPGIGPYAAGNIMQLLGRYSRLALDTESVRHARVVLGLDGTDAQLMKAVSEHYEAFGEHKFRSYWFAHWIDYEEKHGKSWTWVRETTGTQFTAAQLKKAQGQKRRAKGG